MGQRWNRFMRTMSGDRGPGPETMAGVAAVIGVPRPHLLAWGTGTHAGRPVTVVAVDEGLALVDGQGDALAVAWHEVVRGGWNSDTSTLHWTFLDGDRDEVVLERQGDLPTVFNDRVTASIVVREPIEVAGGRVTVAGRRRMGSLDDGQILWTAIADGKASLADPRTGEQVLERTEQLRRQWR